MSALNVISISASVLAILISALSVMTSKATDWWLKEARMIRLGCPPRDEPRWIRFVRFTLRRPKG